jgi:Tfp pilus assembly protein PilX
MKNKFLQTSIRKQRGYLSLVAVFIVVAIGFMALSVAQSFYGQSSSTGNFQNAESAFYVAESGLEKANRLLQTPFLTGSNPRIACGSLSGNANLTNSTVGSGTMTVTTVGTAPIYVATKLGGSATLTAAATTIPVTSTTGFSSSGRLMIDQEIIQYGGISGNSFIACQRGVNSSVPVTHTVNTGASQFQCNLDSKGGVPSLTAYLGQRELQQSVQLQEGWAAGTVSSTNDTFTRWNHPTELSWTSSPFASGSTAATLNAISMLSNAEGFAAGNTSGTNFTLLHWTGAAWAATTLAATCAVQNLMGITAVSSQEAWAVGVRFQTNCSSGNYRYDILHWNGTAWAALSPTSTPATPADAAANQTLNAVQVIATGGSSTGNLGFAVGNAGVILKYNGTTWAAMTSPTTQNLMGVNIISTTEAWAVGAAGVILKYNGSTWSTITSPTTTQLNSITMVSMTQSGAATAGMAVGNTGAAIVYNGTAWSANNTAVTGNLHGVAMFFNPADVWAVGDAGAIQHWNGTAWASVTSGVTVALNGISLIVPQPYGSAWQEVFN